MTDALLDREIIDDMVEHIGADALRPVIVLFIDDSRRYAAQIRDGTDAGAAGREAARRAAHSLKSSAGQLGAAALSAQAAAIERTAAETADPLGEAATALAACVEQTAAALARLFGS